MSPVTLNSETNLGKVRFFPITFSIITVLFKFYLVFETLKLFNYFTGE